MSEPLTIAYQGEPGAYSDLAAAALYPASRRIGCASFAEALACPANIVIIPVTNTIAGPVSNALRLLKASPLRVIGEHWQPIRHALLALPAASLGDVRTVHSHWQALKQCERTLQGLRLTGIEHADTAGAARMVATGRDVSQAAIASTQAAKEYGLKILKEGLQDDPDNKTLFLLLAHDANGIPLSDALSRLNLSA